MHEDGTESNNLGKFGVEFKESLIRLLVWPIGGKSDGRRDIFWMRVVEKVE